MSDLRVGVSGCPVRVRERFDEVWRILREEQGDRPWMLVVDARLARAQPHCLRGLRAAQTRDRIELPGGESVKSLRRFAQLHRHALEIGLPPDGLVVALGGGTVGDLAGFFASTWMRGVDWVCVGTTTLSLADSSIGGKTAVDLGGVKNVVGAFHEPVGVYGALEALRSLPGRHLRAGAAEVVKSAVIADGRLFDRLESVAEALLDPASPEWIEVIRGAARVKAEVVAEDPRERGRRQILNFGHTLGHAIESVHRPRLLHGEAVSLGMIAAAWISEWRIGAPEGTTHRIRELLGRLRLPRELRSVDEASLWRAMSYDKKARRGEPALVLTPEIGSATFGHRVERQILQRALRRLRPRPR